MRVKHVVINNHLDVDDLVLMLEVTPEDMLDRFEDRLLEHQDKFLLEGDYDQLGEEELGEEQETQDSEEETTEEA